MSLVFPRIRCRPIPNSYVAMGGFVAAGEYPGSPPSANREAAAAKLGAFLEAGITTFVDLTGPADGLTPYEGDLHELALSRGTAVVHRRLHVPDMDICDATHMNVILDTIDEFVQAGHGVYVHCWGGVGRTGMVVGCWMVRHGYDGTAALTEVLALFRSMTEEKWNRHRTWGSPQTEAQRHVVREWAQHDTTRTVTLNPRPTGLS